LGGGGTFAIAFKIDLQNYIRTIKLKHGHLHQHFFHISEPNKGTKGPENHSLG
jgi:hypothetical protein